MSGNLIFNIFLQFQAEYNPSYLADSASSPVHFVAVGHLLLGILGGVGMFCRGLLWG